MEIDKRLSIDGDNLIYIWDMDTLDDVYKTEYDHQKLHFSREVLEKLVEKAYPSELKFAVINTPGKYTKYMEKWDDYAGYHERPFNYEKTVNIRLSLKIFPGAEPSLWVEYE